MIRVGTGGGVTVIQNPGTTQARAGGGAFSYATNANGNEDHFIGRGNAAVDGTSFSDTGVATTAPAAVGFEAQQSYYAIGDTTNNDQLKATKVQFAEARAVDPSDPTIAKAEGNSYHKGLVIGDASDPSVEASTFLKSNIDATAGDSFVETKPEALVVAKSGTDEALAGINASVKARAAVPELDADSYVDL